MFGVQQMLRRLIEHDHLGDCVDRLLRVIGYALLSGFNWLTVGLCKRPVAI